MFGAIKQHLCYWAGTESKSWKLAARVLIVQFAFPLVFLWLVCVAIVIGMLIKSGAAVGGAPSRFESKENPPINSTYTFDRSELFWFIQITDVHVSRRISDVFQRFSSFLTVNLPTVNPAFVVNTGDLVDAVSEDDPLFHSWSRAAIQLDQWQAYQELLRGHLGDNFNPNYWIDFRGNHDTYNLQSEGSTNNLFAKYSVAALGPNSLDRVYTYSYTTPQSRYSFIIMDLTFPVGVTLPFNYYASITESEKTQIRNEIQSAQGSNHTFALAHFPIGCINSDDHPAFNSRFFFRDAFGDSVTAYFSGHLHKTRMYYANNNFLDLNLNDFKSDSYYRVNVVDNDIFTFVDVNINTWPVIAVTNPIDARIMARTDKWERMGRSTEMRMLIFSPNPIVTILIYLDGRLQTEVRNGVAVLNSFTTDGTGLYMFPWDPTSFRTGNFHRLEVVAADSQGNQQTQQFDFSLNGHVKNIGTIGAWFWLESNQQALLLCVLLLFYVYAMLFCLLLPKLLYLFLIACAPKRYEAYRVRIWDKMQEWAGVKLLDSSLPHTHPVTSGASDTFVTYAPPTNPATTAPTSNGRSSGKLSRLCTAPLVLASWFGEAFMWHTWKYMHMSNLWFFILFFVGLYLVSAPIFVGPLVGGNWGALFLWGIVAVGTTMHTIQQVFYLFPTFLLLFLPTVFLCATHNDYQRLRMKVHYQKTSNSNSQNMVPTFVPSDSGSLPSHVPKKMVSNLSTGEKVKGSSSARYHLFRMRWQSNFLIIAIAVGAILMLYAHNKFIGAESYLVSPGIFYLTVLACVRAASEYSESYFFFNYRCRRKVKKRWMVV